MTDKMKAFAYLHTGDELPGFRQLILKRDDDLALPIVDQVSGQIVDFEIATDIDEEDIIEFEAPTSVEMGDKAIYVYKFPDHPNQRNTVPNIVVGDRTSVSIAVHRGMRRLRGFPFARLEAAAFMHDRRRTEQFAREAACTILLSSENATLSQAKALVARYLGDSMIHDRWLMAEFCRGLIGYYQLYHRLLHVSDRTSRLRLQSRFDTSARFIMPFLIDDDFLSRIEQDALVHSRAEDLSDVTEKAAQDVTRILTNLGVSRSSSQMFLTKVQNVLSSDPELPFPPLVHRARFSSDHIHLSKAGLLVPLTYSALRQRDTVDLTLDRWQKRLSKQRLDTNFASLAYGLLILIHAEVIPESRTNSIRAFGLASLNAGLRGMSYQPNDTY